MMSTQATLAGPGPRSPRVGSGDAMGSDGRPPAPDPWRRNREGLRCPAAAAADCGMALKFCPSKRSPLAPLRLSGGVPAVSAAIGSSARASPAQCTVGQEMSISIRACDG